MAAIRLNRIASLSNKSSVTTVQRYSHNIAPEATDKPLATTGQSHKADHTSQPNPKPLSIAERDAMLMNAWKDREGSLANAEFEDGKVEEGYRRHVKANIFRYI